ncbi:hypothetical protein ACIO3O_19685 [Streptomyces sp. NPDC087440]|uniref:hypothetical protein n=1 Tax=Streptomyces sp. NPDC087440 TaxID=3365790 RepID=UPI0037F70F5D
MTRNAETPRGLSGAFQEIRAVGAWPIVTQLARRREAVERCEPLDCGHQDPFDCAAGRGGQADEGLRDSPETNVSPPDVDGDRATLWADAKALYLAGDFPKYASPLWMTLRPDDPKRLAAVLYAAEMWRKYGDEEALLAWFRDARRGRDPLASRKTLAELDEAAQPKPAHQLQATPGWPPIAIPGQPGRYLTYTEDRRAAA